MTQRIAEAVALKAHSPSSSFLTSIIYLVVLKGWQFLRHLAWVFQFLVLGWLQPEDSIWMLEFPPRHLSILMAKANVPEALWASTWPSFLPPRSSVRGHPSPYRWEEPLTPRGGFGSAQTQSYHQSLSHIRNAVTGMLLLSQQRRREMYL